MFDALEPCCAQALAKLKSEIAPNSTFPMLPPPRSRRPQSYRAACRLRVAVRWPRPADFFILLSAREDQDLDCIVVGGNSCAAHGDVGSRRQSCRQEWRRW